MLRNYLKIAWKNITKNKVFSFINIFGLTTGITVCLMIFLFVMNEFSFDNFHTKGKYIYRVMRGYDPAKARAPYVSGPYAPALLNDFKGEIKMAVRIMISTDLVTFNNRSFNENKVYFADGNFFNLFSFPLLKGNPATALQDVNSIVMTETTAKKYFGDEDPMGKIVQIDKDRRLKVTGIAKDVPSNSHLDFDMVTPLAVYSTQPFFRRWINNNNFTYLLLDEHANPKNIQARFPAFMHKYVDPETQKLGFTFNLTITPLRDIYFEDASPFDNVRHGDKKVVYVFLSIAALIMLIACINFMNLSTIRAAERGKEVGLRKVMGALRKSLTWQFLGESVLLTVIACILSIGLLLLLMPLYDNLLGYKLPVPYNEWYLYAFLAGAILIIGLLAGSYPALILSAFSPIEALKGKLKLGKGGSLFRQILVVVQFSISVFLITGTIVINKQMSYVKNKQLGYNQQQALVIPLNNNDIVNHQDEFKQQLQNNSNVAGVSLMSGEPGGFFDLFSFQAEGQGDRNWNARTEFADFEFVKTIGLKIIAGRDFSAKFPTDSTSAVLINRMAAQSLGYTPQQNILSIFSCLAIVIACLGLFGLASFTATKRTKEIGVRKVLGSSVRNIVFLLSKELLKPVLLATAIALPVAYLAMHNWLLNFAYRTSLQWWVFLLSASVTIAIALLTVSFRAVRAALANPTKSLKIE